MLAINKISRRSFLKLSLLGCATAVVPFSYTGCATLPSKSVSLPDASQLTLQQKIAQMLMIGFRGITISDSDPIARDIAQLGIGAVILFDYDLLLKSYDRDIASPEQLRELTAALSSRAAIPLLIAVDQEGGRVERLKLRHGFPPTVSAQYLGRVNAPAQTAWFSDATAKTLRKAGINVNFAPVVDLNINPDNPVIGRLERSFSADPTVVTTHARQVVLAHERNGILTSLKHFPGHGSSSTDSHKGFVDLTDTWNESELAPYRILISEGLCRMVMVGHIFNRRIDLDYPATLSSATINGLLRQKLGFNGVVVSDDLQMGAISQYYPLETAVEKAIIAGVDILDICNEAHYDPDVAGKVIDLVTSLVKRGVITEERINLSYYRIRSLKQFLI